MKTVELTTGVEPPRRLRLDDIPESETAKRALEVALAGGHPLVFIYTKDAPAVELVNIGKAMAETVGLPFHGLAFPACPCGGYGSTAQSCECSLGRIARHQMKLARRVSEFDMAVTVIAPRLNHTCRGETEQEVMSRVDNARAWQLADRTLGKDCLALLKMYAEPNGATRLAYARRIAETIARLDGANRVQPQHLCEALQYQEPFRVLTGLAEVEVRAGKGRTEGRHSHAG